MSEIANWSVQVQIVGSRPINLGGQEKADGFDKMSPTIPASSDGTTAATRPVPVDDKTRLLVVSTEDTTGNLSITFAGSGGAKSQTPVPLTRDKPLFLMGQELIANQVNGGADKTAQLIFSNLVKQDIAVDILILCDLG